MEISYKLNEIEHVAQEVIKNAKSRTLLFYGDMGVGKTTLVSALVKVLGSSDKVSSPTFSIVNEYKTDTESIYHFDMFRIKNVEEAYNFGIEDYLDSDNWKLVEWPEKIDAILFDDIDEIHLKLDINNSRVLTMKNL